jgi:hypothetical protein
MKVANVAVKPTNTAVLASVAAVDDFPVRNS